jgi:hypothetical protein
VRHIEVNPADVRVVGTPRHRYPEGPTTGPGAWLRRNRLRLAGGLALIEAIFFAFHWARTLMLAVAVIAILFHWFVTPRIRSYTFRQVSWVVAFAQALIAICSVALLVVSALVAFVLLVVVIGFVVFAAAALLGDRR